MGTLGRRLAVLAFLPACNAIFGVDDLTYVEGSGGTGGQGGGICSEGDTQPCYDGPVDTADVGICASGEQACVDDDWGPCTGEVFPGIETCAATDDEDCDGYDCADVVWARLFGGPGEELAWSVAARTDGTLVVGGHHGPRADLGGPVPAPTAEVSGYVALLEETGEPRWVHGFDGAGTRYVTDVAVTPRGDVIALGIFDGTLELDGSLVASAGGTDLFVLALSPAGDVIWSQAFGSPSTELAYGLDVGQDGEIVVAGYYGEAFSTGDVSLPPPIDADGFALRIDDQGTPLAAHVLTGLGNEYPRDVVLHADGDITVVGYFDGTLVIDNNPFTASGMNDAFALRVTEGLQTRWVRAWGGPGTERLHGVAITADDGDALIGSLAGTVDFDGTSVTSFGDDDVLFAKMSAGGQLAWVKHFGGAAEDWGFGVAVDDDGGIHISGHFQQGIVFGSESHTGAASNNLFYARFDTAGLLERSRGFSFPGQTAPPYGWPSRRRLAIAPNGDAVIVTHLTDTATLDDQELTTVAGSNDALVVRLAH